MYYQIAWQRLRRKIQPALDYRPSPRMLIIISSVVLLLAIVAGSSLVDDFLASFDVRKTIYVESEEGLSTQAPELSEDLEWINIEPQKIGQNDAKVTVVNFWNASCATCLDANAAVNNWNSKYKEAGLQVIGINAPDFSFEIDEPYIKKSIKSQRLNFPNAIDLTYETSDAYELGNGSLITIIDADGIVRHRSVYAEDLRNSELVIQGLLEEAGVTEAFGPPSGKPTKTQQIQTNLYFGSVDEETAKKFVGDKKLTDEKQTYMASPVASLQQWSLSGTWLRDSESLLAVSDSKIHTQISGSRVYVVADAPKNGFIGASVDGEVKQLAPGIDKDGIMDVEGPGLYQLVASKDKLKNAQLLVAPSDGTKVYQLIVLP
ncbi:redoxin domain-containing protein [Candidatus Saccharibacteria bacterium]|jgi:thiol-disulfide isomerase/thioredoxin|nr:redoxin domain-containing protein [Candidatus Saccharibacteria bacterium]